MSFCYIQFGNRVNNTLVVVVYFGEQRRSRQAETERGPQEGKCRETEEVMVVQQQQQQHACGGDIGLFERTNERSSEGIQVGGE